MFPPKKISFGRALSRKNPRRIFLWPVLAGSVAALLSGICRADEVWDGSVSGNWSDAAPWLDNTAPAPGGNPSLSVLFAGDLAVNYTATNNLGSPFVLNRLLFDTYSLFGVTIASAAGNSIELGGSAPAILQNGSGAVTISSPLIMHGATGTVTIGGVNVGALSVTGKLSETDGPQTLVIAANPPFSNAQLISLSGNNTFTGGVRLDSGNLELRSNNALGSGSLVVNGGTLSLGTTTIANGIVLNQDFVIQSPGGTTLSGIVSGSAGLTLRTTSFATGLKLAGANTYSGATTLDFHQAAALAPIDGGTISLTGNGSALNSSAFNIRAGSLLQIVAASTGATNRLGDAAPVNLRSGQLALAGSAGSIAQTESVGPLSSAGYSTVTVTATSASTRLTAASLDRLERGTFLFRGSALGGTFANGVANILFTSAPAGSVGSGAGSILPFAIGDATATGTGATFLNYSATTGLRPLATAEYGTSLAAANSLANVRLTATESLPTAKTINSLIVIGNTAGGSTTVSGGGALTLASGALLATAGTSTIGTALYFGTTEASIFSLGTLTISGAISGTNGLTKSGSGNLLLNTANSITGPLTINAGLISFSSEGALGNVDATVVLNGTGAGLSYVGNAGAPYLLARDLAADTGIALLTVTDAGRIAMTGHISGAGGMRFAAGTGWISLPAGNTYTGPTIVSSGTLIIPEDSALGAGQAIEVSGGATLQLAGPWTTDRAVSTSLNAGSAKIDTAGFAATINGPLIGTTPLVKSGNGTLTIAAPGTYSGEVTVEKGRLVLTGGGSLRSTSLTVSSGGKFVLDYTASTRAGRIPSSAAVRLQGGELRILGSSTASIRQVLASVGFSTDSASTLTLTAPGGGSTILSADVWNGAGAPGLVRGTNLGGPSTGPFSRVIFPSLTQALAAATVAGLVVDADPNGTGSSFATYDFAPEGSIPVGLRPLRASEYVGGAVIQNPANGGATAVGAAFLASGVVTPVGAHNTVGTLTMDAGSGIALQAGQTLSVAGAGVLARAGGTVSITGGTLEFLSGAALIHAGSDATISSALNSGSLVRKTGPGTLTLAGPVRLGGSGLTVFDGAIRPGSAGAFASETLVLNGAGALDLGGLSASVGGLAGTGTVRLGDRTLTLGASSFPTNFSGSIVGTGSLEIVDGGVPFALRTLSGASTFTGGVTLTSGRLVAGAAALGTGAITAQGGALQPGAGYILSNPLTITGSLAITGSNGLTIPAGTALNGPGDLVFRGAGTITIQTDASLAGSLRTGLALPGDRPSAVRTLVVSGPSGAFSGLAEIRFENGTLRLDDSAGGPLAGNRLSPATPIFLRNATLALTGGNTAPATESTGPLTIAGESFITVTPRTATASLTIPSIARSDRGVLNVRGEGLGGSGITQSRIFLSAPPQIVGGAGTGAETSIVPWATGFNTQNGSTPTFVTYSAATGLRPLDATTEMPFTSFSAAVSATGNYRATTTTATNSPVQVNALALTGGTVRGTGTIRLGSGALLDPAGTTVLNPIDFGTVEGRIWSPPITISIATILSGPISGTGGLTKAGSGILTLTADNSFTGGLVVDSGTLRFSSPGNLGADLTPIRLQAGALQYTGTSPLTLARGLELFGASVYGSTAAPLTVAGVVAGPGGLSVPSGGALRLTGANTYSGPTTIEGTLTIASDASLGSGGHVEIGNRLNLAGNWTTSRAIEVRNSTPAIDVATFDAVWNGPLLRSDTASLNKFGTGTLTLNAASPFDGTLNINAGTVRLAGAGRIPTSSVFLRENTALILDNTLLADSNRISETATIQLVGGELQIVGNVSAPVRERFGPLLLTGSIGRVILDAPGSAPLTATFSGIPLNFGRLTVRGTGLGNPDTGSLTRFVFQTPPALANGIIPLMMADRGDGLGVAFATYDSTVDREGPIGLRPLLSSEYATDFTRPNGATLNFRTSGNASLPAALASAPVGSLTIAPNTHFTLSAKQQLLVGVSGILAQAGGPSSLEGGTLVFGSNQVNLLGDGNLTITSDFSGSGGFLKSGTGTVLLAGPTRWNGTLNVVEGTLKVSPATAFQSVTLALANPGTFALQDVPTDVGALSGNGAVELGQGILRLTGTTAAFTGDVRGAGDLQVFGSVKMTGANTFSGLTRIGSDPNRLTTGATLTFSGNGTALASRGIVASTNGVLQIDAAASADSLTRFGQVPVTLSGGSLLVSSGVGVGVIHSLGTLTGSGYSSASIQTGSPTQPAGLLFGDFARADRGTLKFSFSSLTTNSIRFTSGLAPALIGSGIGPAATPVLPFAVDASVTGVPRLVTFDGVTGIRPIDIATQMNTNFVAGQNINVVTDTTLATNVTVNALRTTANLLGTGRITVSSGVVLPGPGLFNPPLDFGTVEGFIFSNGSQPTLSGAISGSGGLTISANPGESVSLAAINTFSGPITINSAALTFNTSANLGAGSAPIVIHSGQLRYNGSEPLALSRPIRTVGAQSGLIGTVNVAEPISGPGGMLFGDQVNLLGANSYEGATQIAGFVKAANDAVFGASPSLNFAPILGSTARLRLGGDLISNRNFGGQVLIDTNGFKAKMGGTFEKNSTLVKEGAGTLSVDDPRNLGFVTVAGGVLDLNRVPGTVGPAGVVVNSAATLSGSAAITGSLFLESGARLALEIGGSTPGLYDQFSAATGLSLASNVTLSLSLLNYAPAFGDVFFLVTHDDATFPAIPFNGLPEGATVSLGGPWRGTLTYRANWLGSQSASTLTGGNDIALSRVVPEPGVGSALFLGAALLWNCRRQRRDFPLR